MNLGLLKAANLRPLCALLKVTTPKPCIESALVRVLTKSVVLEDLTEAHDELLQKQRQLIDERKMALKPIQLKEFEWADRQASRGLEQQSLAQQHGHITQASDSSQSIRESVKMGHLLQPYKTGADVGLFLVYFGRVYELHGFFLLSWHRDI